MWEGLYRRFSRLWILKSVKTQKKEWFKEIPQYFEKRENLEHVILFTDARHPMRDQDVGMAEILFDLNIPFKMF